MNANRMGNAVLGGCIALCTAALIYVIVVYDVLRAGGISGWGLALYHLIPGLAAALLFACLRLPIGTKVNLALAIVSIAFAVYAVEAFLYVKSVRADPGTDRPGTVFDKRTKFEIIAALRKDGHDAYPNITPGIFLPRRGQEALHSTLTMDGQEILPLAGIANAVKVMGRETGVWDIYRTDELGFHNPQGIWRRPAIDVAVIGDSFAQGFSAPSGETFADLIRKQYATTLNLGMAGNGPLLQLATVREYLPAITPRMVLWFFYEGNDLCELRSERTSPLLRRYLEDSYSQQLVQRREAVDRALRDYVDSRLPAASWLKTMGREVVGVLTLNHLRERLGLVFGTGTWPVERYGCTFVNGAYHLDEFRASDAALLEEVLTSAVDSISAWGGTMYFVYLPTWQRYRYPQLANSDRDRVLALVRSNGIPVVDMHPVFQAKSDPLALFPYRGHGHYNARGHRVVAQEVLKLLSGR